MNRLSSVDDHLPLLCRNEEEKRLTQKSNQTLTISCRMRMRKVANSKKQEDTELDPKRAARSERFLSILKRHQIPKHGAQTIIAKEIGVSDATIAAWMRGSLPRDPVVLINFCDAYSVDLYWWVNGTPRPHGGVAVDKLVRSFQTVSKFLSSRSIVASDEQVMALCAKIYNEPSNTEEYLEMMAEILAY
jgi:hypothetical protein